METNNLHNEGWVSEAQREVWEWKEKVSEELNALPPGERLKYIIEQTKDIVEEIKAKREAKKTNSKS